MKKHILCSALAALALSFIFGGGVAEASPQGQKFCERSHTPSQLEAKVVRSLQSDPTGNKNLEGCNANPLDFVEAWKNDTDIRKVSELPAFVRGFVVIDLPPGQKVWSACVRNDFNGVIIRCVERTLAPGEHAYGRDGVALLLEGCVNPVNLAVEEIVVAANPCVKVVFPGRKGGAIRIAYIDQKALPSTCLLLERSGVKESLRGIPQECPDSYDKVINGRKVRIACTWEPVELAASEHLGFQAEVQNVAGSFYAKGDGSNTLTLPREALNGETAICYELADGTFVTYGVRGKHFVNGVATITDGHVFHSAP